jgi:signal transduction histidine kinase
MGQVDLPELLDQCCIVVESDIVGRGLGIHYGFKVEAPEQFITDGELLRQTLLNLLSNAVKFTDKGEISIEVSGSSDRITIEVKDTGCGIPPMQRHKLFKRGERLGAENSAIPGYGIGLAMAQRLVKAMSGDIGYRENQGGGSIFWISLPAGATAEAMPILGVAQHELMVSDTP